MQRDLILSVLEAHPSARDSRFYLKNFAPSPTPSPSPSQSTTAPLTRPTDSPEPPPFPLSESEAATPTTAFIQTGSASSTEPQVVEGKTPLADELLSATSHTALVKIQGPFTDRQLESIAEGMVYLKKLGLVSIIVMDSEDWLDEQHEILSLSHGEKRARIIHLRERMKADTLKFADLLEQKGGEARPLLEGVLCVPGAEFSDSFTPIASTSEVPYERAPEKDLFVDSLSGIRDAIRRGEIPVIPPVALDSACFSLCVSANDAVRAISSGLADHERRAGLRYESETRLRHDVDLTPVRIMVINREGGIPSPARAGNPHLSINLESEFEHIGTTFTWHDSHPTSLANLALIRSCLVDLPRTASAVLVSHRSPRSLIANLITNKPAHSPSLHHSLLPSENLQHQPTIVRRGLPIRVSRSMAELDQPKLTALLEASFGRQLDAQPFYDRLSRDLDFCIIAGDYQGVAIVTNEPRPSPSSSPIAYLDKFAVLPSLQGDGTVDFLWGALRDESFGLGLPSALNPNVGGLQGKGEGRDLVWRSRANNPVNKWYFERSNGFFKIPPPRGSQVGFALFWLSRRRTFQNLRMGYANVSQVGSGLHMRQRARAFLVAESADPSQRVLFINIDCGMGDSAITRGVLARLEELYPGVYSASNVALAGTHTHSGVGGFLENLLPQTYEAIVAGSIIAVQRAHANLAPGSLSIGNSTLLNSNLNRSPTAYLVNPAEERAQYEHDVEKEFTLVKFDDAATGTSKGFLSFFSVHGTSIFQNQSLISGDNKVSYSGPGFRVSDFESNRIIGTNQHDAAVALMSSSLTAISGPIKSTHQYTTMANYTFPLANGTDATLCTAALGYGFAGGTTDGAGGFPFIQGANTSQSQNPFWEAVQLGTSPQATEEQRKCQAPKPILLNTGAYHVPYDWAPAIVAHQMFRIGQLIIIMSPSEPTTMAGRRIR
ncbi:hypothetical protein RQP46_005647 [Phenoliferia psychrophenolica]